MTQPSGYILVCKCSGVTERAATAFEIKFPGEELPPIVRGRDEIMKLAYATENDHIKAIAKIRGQFSYYLKISENGIIEEEYDLTSGRRLQ